MAKPTSVRVVGGIWIGFGCLLVLGSLVGFAWWLFADHAGRSAPAGLPGPLGLTFTQYAMLCVAQLLVGGFGIVAGIEFLHLQKWARPALEVLTWLAFALIAGTQALVIRAVLSQLSRGEVAIIVLILALIDVATFMVPCGYILRALRGKHLRAVFESLSPG